MANRITPTSNVGVCDLEGFIEVLDLQSMKPGARQIFCKFACGKLYLGP